MLDLKHGRKARLIVPMALLVGLAACSKQEDKPAATPAATTPDAAAP
nr:energy transducer TonB [Xanthomonadaceae bacterium]